jgi:hypothetical protein
MKNKFLLIIWMAITLFVGAQAQNKTAVSSKAAPESGYGHLSATEIFPKAIVWWDFSDLNDQVGLNSQFKVNEDKILSDKLQGREYKASKDHGGDGYVIDLNEIHLKTGQGAEGELNLSGPFQNI